MAKHKQKAFNSLFYLSVWSNIPKRPFAEPDLPSMFRTGSRIPFWRLHLRRLQVLLWSHLQQPLCHSRLQEQLQVCHWQEEQDSVQRVSSQEMPIHGHVQGRFSLWKTVQLVQDPLPNAAGYSTGRAGSRENRTGCATGVTATGSSSTAPHAKSGLGTQPFKPISLQSEKWIKATWVEYDALEPQL